MADNTDIEVSEKFYIVHLYHIINNSIDYVNFNTISLTEDVNGIKNFVIF